MNDYRSEFKKFIRLRNSFLVLWLGFAPTFAIIGKSFSKNQSVAGIETALICVWVVTFIYISIRLAFWRCPRCGNRFIGQKWYGPDLAAWQCGHCGLERPSFRKMTAK